MSYFRFRHEVRALKAVAQSSTDAAHAGVLDGRMPTSDVRGEGVVVNDVDVNDVDVDVARTSTSPNSPVDELEEGPRTRTSARSEDTYEAPVPVPDKPTSARLPNMHGQTWEEADGLLSSEGFAREKTTDGGYIRYGHADGSKVWIRPDGEVQRLGPKKDAGSQAKNYHPRYGPDGERTQSHSTGERVQRS